MAEFVRHLVHLRFCGIRGFIFLALAGFSVDFTAHIIYGFTTSSASESVRARVTDAIVRLAWPVTQGALSTVIGVSVLTNGDRCALIWRRKQEIACSYMLTVFTKTIVLVMTLGTVHALVLLPILLDTLTPHILGHPRRNRDS